MAALPAAALGRTATRILLDWIRSLSPDLRTVNQRIWLRTELVMGRSCECAVVRRTGSDLGSAVRGSCSFQIGWKIKARPFSWSEGGVR